MPLPHADRLPSPVRRRLVRAIGGAGALGAAGCLSACGGGGGGGADGGGAEDEPIAASLLDVTPANQAATYRHVDRLYATRPIRRGTAVRALPPHAVSLQNLQYAGSAGLSTVADYMARCRCTGLLVVQDGKVALERYGLGNGPASRWTSFSVAKSLTSTLIGLALRDGAIRNLDDDVAGYVPALASGSYAGCSIRSLLRMTSGVAWNEAYSLTGNSDIVRLAAAFSSGRPGAVLEVIASLGRAAPSGTVFNYSTAETYVLGAVLAGALGSNLSDYASQRVWAPAGMEADGYWLLDAPGGLEMGGNNFSATLRDYARLGLFMLEGGAGTSTLPAGWLSLAGHPDNALTGYGRLYAGYPLGYGYQWWAFPTDASVAPHEGAFTGQGIQGQFLYLNPTRRVVAVVWSAWPDTWVNAHEAETYALLGAAVNALGA